MRQSTATAGKGWKILIGAGFAAFLAGMTVTFFLAATRGSGVADREYYRHGRQYGRTASGSRNPGLEYRISASLSSSRLQVRVADASGKPVAGGKLTFLADPGTSAADSRGAFPSIILAETAPGAFDGPCPSSPTGELHGTLRFTCGEAFATKKLVLFN